MYNFMDLRKISILKPKKGANILNLGPNKLDNV